MLTINERGLNLELLKLGQHGWNWNWRALC